MNINPNKDTETLVCLYEDVHALTDGYTRAWGGVSLMTGRPYIAYTPPCTIPRFSVKQERFFKVFLLAAHLHFMLTGEVDYRPKRVYNAYGLVFPREYYPFGCEQVLPDFDEA